MKKIIFISTVVALIIFGCNAMKPDTFGAHPKGARLERIKRSPQYRNGDFQNFSPTPMMVEGASYWKIISWYTWNKPVTTPPGHIPFIKRDLKAPISADSKPVITWFGHSSYLLQLGGKNILVDPVFCGYASPFPWLGVKSYKGSNEYVLTDLPHIDLVLLSHDHYDHLDYSSIVFLKDKVKNFVAPLGVGAHLEHWGVPAGHITEFDWWEKGEFLDSLQLICTPARHFSGRGVQRGQSLWASYVLKYKDYNIYIGGDSGYDTHFAEIGRQYGPFDLAILECGQYNAYWKYIHMHPTEITQASKDLQANALFPVHWAKFSLSVHPWDESITLLTAAATKDSVALVTPMIGEAMVLNSIMPQKMWWKEVKKQPK